MTRDDSEAMADLINRIGKGDGDAITALIQHNARRLESLARNMLRGYPALRRWVETSDVLQGALMRLVRALREVEVESQRHLLSLSALQIRRELIDLGRRYLGPTGLGAKHESRAGKDSQQRAEVEVPDLTNEPYSLAQWCELHEQIGLLPDNEREAMDLLYYDGLSQQEAAETLDVSVRTVQRRWHSALLMLHERLGDQWSGI